ncbi:unnamed protein product (macronuclear) [Paramecium tetraurelia]|uniref:Uncharacterized protein n=1 Tax=Paramecium tetraurelia TaxID=5888 RepID=A0EBC3_PARTE|nr:uncharacterized protein GSPATT00025324001 [Paramecium tetraurelia]CAK92590.1 unnamed protein product [Paramecium tetraurelia]|eukprot:XP_001459987.1 hypothetical protein (macronuclear) [Paramecium tetraurelia strain d4-2]
MRLFSNKFGGFESSILKQLIQDCFYENLYNKQRNGQLKMCNLSSKNEVEFNFNNQVSSLRGGGCISTTLVSPETKTRLSNQESNFATNLKNYTKVIVEKASQFHDKYHKDDVLCALLWFQNQKEHFQKLCMNKEQNLQNYDLIERQFENLLKQLVTYLKLSGYVFHVLLQICNDLLRVIFYFQQVNEDRYMKEDLKQSLKECILELEEQIGIESAKLWSTGTEFELLMIKTCLAHLRTNSKESANLMKAVLMGIASSLAQLKPSDELIDALMEAGKYLLLNFYDKQIKHPLKVYELYFFFENLKWSIIFQLKSGYSVQQTINQLTDGYNKYIGASTNWLVHFFWINLISSLMSYRPIISKPEMEQRLLQKYNTNWNQLVLQNQIVTVPYDKTKGRIKYNGRGNFVIKEFSNLKLFQDYLFGEQIGSMKLLPQYLNFDFGSQQQGRINLQDLNITLFTNCDDLEVLSSLNNVLKNCLNLIQENFNQIDGQVQSDSLTQTEKQTEFKICKQDIQYLINQQKEQFLQILYIFYEIDIIRFKEIEIMNNIETVMKKLMQQMQNFNQIRILSEKEIESKFQQIPRFQYQFSQILISYEDFIQNDVILTEVSSLIPLKQSLKKYQQELENFIKSFSDDINSFITQMKQLKQIITKVNCQSQLKITQDMISQKDISNQLVQIYGSKLIKNLCDQIMKVYSEDWIDKNWEFSILNDFRKSIRRCGEMTFAFKFLKKLLKIQQQKVNAILNEDNIAELYFISNVQSTNLFESDSMAFDQIQTLALERKAMIQGYFEKYPNLIMNKQEISELNQLENQIREDIMLLQQKKWNQQYKISSILIFQDALNKLSQLGLNKVNKLAIKEEINTNFTKSLQELNKKILGDNQKEEQIKQIQMQNKIEQDSQIFFIFEYYITQTTTIIINTKRLKRIIKQNFNLFSWSMEIWESDKKEEFQNNIKALITDLLESISDCFSSFQKEEQIVFNQEVFEFLQDNKCLDKQKANLVLLNSHSIFKNSSSNEGIEEKCCKIYKELIENLKNSSAIDAQKPNILSQIFSNSSHKVREALAFSIIKMDTLIQEPKMKDFCQNLLKMLWIYEKHSDVRIILKNTEMIEIQKQLFSNDLTTMSNQIKAEMKSMLNRIEQLENSVLTDNTIQAKEQLQQALDDFETYFDNITDMSQKLDISMIFLKELSKDVKHIKSSIDSVLKSVSFIANDVRKLRGKNYLELLQIRKEQVLRQKDENEIDQIHIELLTQEYDPISGSKKQSDIKEETTFLLKQNYNDFEGEINEFLWDENERIKDVMLLKGRAGSGKSRAAKNIEELLWTCDQVDPKWVPIYVSLPSLKEPKYNLVDQALESENYNFDNIQIREFKEAIRQKNLNVVLILESYDEMKQDCLEQNLYLTNRFAQEFNLGESGENVKIIITSRQEILNSIDYQTWFYGKSIQTLKEVELLPFTSNQSNDYLIQYSKVSVKRTIKRFYEFLKQLKAQSFSFKEFKQIWSNIKETVKKILIKNKDELLIFSQEDTEKLIQKLYSIQFFQLFKPEQMISLNKDLLELWGYEKFSQTIHKVKIKHLLNTPFMLEIIVYVLPKMSTFFSQSSFMRLVLKQNYHKLKKESIRSNHLLKMYSQTNEIVSNEEQLKKLNNFQVNATEDETQLYKLSDLILAELDTQNFFEQNSITQQFIYTDNQIINEKKIIYTLKFDAKFVVAAFQLHQFTAFDFYKQFVDFYHAQQMQKWKELGKNINQQSFLIDLQFFCTSLAVEMTLRELTQVNYKQKGKLKLLSEKEDLQDVSWEDHYFSENEADSKYKTQLRKCMLINAKGSLFSFNHKSIQEFFVADYILNLFDKLFADDNEIDEKLLRKSAFNNRNKFNLSLEQFSGCLELLKPKLKQISNIEEKLIQIIKLQTNQPDCQKDLLRSTSNVIFLLSYLGVYLGGVDLSGIQLSNTKMVGLSFFKSNLNNTVFDNVSIDSCNFTQAKIQNSNWKNLICKEIPSVLGNSKITSILFKGDEAQLISGSDDGTIKILDVDQIQKPVERQFQDQRIKSLSYCKTENTLACLTNNKLHILNAKDLSDSNYDTLINDNYNGVFLSQNNKYVALKNQKSNLIILETQNLLIKNKPQKFSFQSSSSIICMAKSYNSKFLATGGQEVILWEFHSVSQIKMITTLQTNLKDFTCMAFSYDCNFIVIGNQNGIIEIWKMNDLQKIHLLQSIKLDEEIEKIEFSKNNKFLIVKTLTEVFQYNSFGLYNDQEKTVLFMEKYDTKTLIQKQYLLTQDLDACVKKITISSLLLIACVEEKNNKCKLSIWNITKQKSISLVTTLIEDQDEINQLRFSSDEQFLLSSSFNVIFVWDLKEFKLIHKIETQHDVIIDFAFSKDKSCFASCSQHRIELYKNFLEPKNLEINLLRISKNLICQGIQFVEKQLAINGEIGNQSVLQFWNVENLRQELDQKFKEKIQYFKFLYKGECMITVGKLGTFWSKNALNFSEKQIEPLFERFEWKQIGYLNDQIYIFDGENIFRIIYCFGGDEDSVENRHKKIFSAKSLMCATFSDDSKLFAVGLNNGFQLIYLDQILELDENNNYYANDFSISDDSSLLVLATNKGLRIKNLLANEEIFFTLNNKYLSACFMDQGQTILAITNKTLCIFNLKDLNNPINLENLVLSGSNPQRILDIGISEQIMIQYEKCIAVHQLKELGSAQLIQLQNNVTLSKNCLLLEDSNYIGIGIDDTIKVIPISNSIKITLNFNYQPLIGKLLYFQFSLDSQTFLIFGSKKEGQLQSAQIAIDKQQLEIKQSEIKHQNLCYITLNKQQDKLIFMKETVNYKGRVEKLELIDFETFKTIQCIEEFYIDENSKFENASFSENNSYFITSYANSTLKLWDAKTCKLLSKMKSNTKKIDLISISNKEIMAQTSHDLIKFWNLKALRSQSLELDGHSDSIQQIAISPDGLQLISGSRSRIIRWELTKFQKLDVLIKGKALPSVFCFSQDANYIAAADNPPYQIKVWKLNTLYLIENQIRISCYSIPNNLKFNDLGNQLISLYENRITKFQIILDLKQNPLYETQRIMCNKGIPPINYYFSSDKQLLIKTNPLQIIDLQKKYESNQFPIDHSKSNSAEKCVAMSHNKLKLAIQNENEIILWSFKTQKVDHVFVNSIGCAQALVFSNNDQLLFTNYDATIKCFDVTNQYQVRKEFQIVNPVEVNKLQFQQLECFPVKNDDFLFVYSFTQPIKRSLIALALTSDHEQSYTLFENEQGISNFLTAYCEEREILAVQLQDIFQLYDLRSKTKIATLNDNMYTIFNPNFLTFSKNGNYLLSLGTDQDINLWDLSCLEKIKLKLNNLNKINYQEIISISFLDDQDSIQLVQKDENVQFDSISNYNDFYQIFLEQVYYEQLIKKTQHHIMAEDEKYILYIKSVVNEKLIYSFDKFRNQIYCSTFTPCGQNLIVGMNDGSILFFRLNNDLQPICFKSIAISSPILSDQCSIRQSTFVNQENISLKNLFLEKGAQDQ